MYTHIPIHVWFKLKDCFSADYIFYKDNVGSDFEVSTSSDINKYLYLVILLKTIY